MERIFVRHLRDINHFKHKAWRQTFNTLGKSKVLHHVGVFGALQAMQHRPDEEGLQIRSSVAVRVLRIYCQKIVSQQTKSVHGMQKICRYASGWRSASRMLSPFTLCSAITLALFSFKQSASICRLATS